MLRKKPRKKPRKTTTAQQDMALAWRDIFSVVKPPPPGCATCSHVYGAHYPDGKCGVIFCRCKGYVKRILS